jgi:uncharacterized Zn finger protein (UPF0148 family)
MRTGTVTQVCTGCELILGTIDSINGKFVCPRCGLVSDPKNFNAEQLDAELKQWSKRLHERRPIASDNEYYEDIEETIKEVKPPIAPAIEI